MDTDNKKHPRSSVFYIRRIVGFIACLIALVELISNVVYLGLVRHVITIPLLHYFEARRVLPIIILVGFCLLVPVLFFLKIPIGFRLLSLVGMTTLCSLSMFFVVTWNEYPLNSAVLGERHFYLVIGLETGDQIVNCHLYRCNSKDLKCQSTDLTYVGSDVCRYETRLIADEEANELHILINRHFPDGADQLYYTYGEQTRYYLDSIELDDGIYYLAYSRDWAIQDSPFIYLLYKCTQDYSCQRLPFQYEVAPLFEYFLADIETNHLEYAFDIIIADTLIYSYGETPYCYVQGCSLQDK